MMWGAPATFFNIVPKKCTDNQKRSTRRKKLDKSKTFACEFKHCGKMFFYKHHLKRHETDSHGRAPVVRETVVQKVLSESQITEKSKKYFVAIKSIIRNIHQRGFFYQQESEVFPCHESDR